MTTNVNIFNHEWCEIVFVHRNQNYGAFVIRQSSGKRHLIAIILALSTIALVIISLNFINNTKGGEATDEGKGEIILTNLPPEKILPKNVIPEVIKKIPQNFRSSIASLIPVITKDADITEVDTIPTNKEIIDFDGAVSNVNVKGDPTGDVRVTAAMITEEPTIDIIDIADNMPLYPGGNDELMKYLGRNINYPRIAIENQSSGTVFIQFVVFASGEIGDIKVLRGFDQSCEAEALRVIKKMSRWIPGKQNGNAVNVRMSIPVRFKLQD